mmetsp:Transcript_2221/g.3668  ORF Transcript_2221/g.3668 Transcript_2221/m.3668 type:complete len:81 (+) Transcript_2221:1216-1458(+)
MCALCIKVTVGRLHGTRCVTLENPCCRCGLVTFSWAHVRSCDCEARQQLVRRSQKVAGSWVRVMHGSRVKAHVAPLPGSC